MKGRLGAETAELAHHSAVYVLMRTFSVQPALEFAIWAHMQLLLWRADGDSELWLKVFHCAIALIWPSTHESSACCIVDP